jgi:hypothetical protein
LSRVPFHPLVTQGFVWGSLSFGGTISVLHVLHNRLDLVQDALVLWLALSFLFGTAVAAACAAAGLLTKVSTRGQNATSQAARTLLARGLALFHVPFFVLGVIIGFTYDQVPFFSPASAWGMLAFLAVLTVVAVAFSIVLSVFVASLLSRLSEHTSRRQVLALFAAVLALHVALPLLFAVLDRNASSGHSSAVRPLRSERRHSEKVFFIGLDGLDWRVVDRMMDQGELPVFADLVHRGVRAPLETLSDANSPLIWASIYTGKDRGKHGCHDFYRIRLPLMKGPGVYPVHRTFFKEAIERLDFLGLVQRVIVNRSCLHARPLWEILDDLRLDIGVVDGYYYSVPARPLQREESYLFSYTLNLVGELELSDSSGLSALVSPPSAAEHFRPAPDFQWQSRTLLSLLESQSQPTYLQLYTHEPDTVQHQFWKWWEPEKYFGVSDAELAANSDQIARVHRSFDRFLSRVMPLLDDGTTLIIASDHGHSPTIVHPYYTQHRHGPPGVLLMAGAGLKEGVVLEDAHIFDITPTILHLLGFPVARDFDGQVLLEALKPPSEPFPPARQIDSYEPFSEAFDDIDFRQELNEEELERLKALGYVL